MMVLKANGNQPTNPSIPKHPRKERQRDMTKEIFAVIIGSGQRTEIELTVRQSLSPSP
jgi:hypothetical protein